MCVITDRILSDVEKKKIDADKEEATKINNWTDSEGWSFYQVFKQILLQLDNFHSNFLTPFRIKVKTEKANSNGSNCKNVKAN